jgi:hypothetical protein
MRHQITTKSCEMTRRRVWGTAGVVECELNLDQSNTGARCVSRDEMGYTFERIAKRRESALDLRRRNSHCSFGKKL